MKIANIGPKNGKMKGSSGKGYGSGKETLRFKSNGTAIVEKAVSYSYRHCETILYPYPT